MKRSMFFFVLFACMFVSAHVVKSQTVKNPTSEQSLQELVTEVRQLRATLQRMNTAVYKGQVLLERLKLQQEQVTRLSRELGEIREGIYNVRGERARIREQTKVVKEGVEAGARHPSELASLNMEMEQLVQREERMIAREARFAADLETEHAILNDLNNKLNALVEIEMTPK